MSTTAMDRRIAERRHEVREDRRRRRLRRTVGVAILIGILALAAMVERSELVALAEVRVEGTARLSADVVREAAALEPGTSTLRLGLGAATARVEALPLVADATARRLDPLTVLVDVVEREPTLTAVAGATAVLVDDEGVVVARGREDGLPLVTLPGDVRLPAPGEEVAASPILAAAHRVRTRLPGPIRADVHHYEAHGSDDVDLVLRSGVRVRVGDAGRMAEKARALGVVLEDLGDAEVAVIDVRAPSAPVVRR